MNLPKFDIKITKRDGKPFVFDTIRQKFVALTPEEWVRQHFVNFLVEHKGYPKELIGNEILIKLNNMPRRCDTVVYDKHLTPVMIVEYKASSVHISEKIFDQIARYNMVLGVKYLVVSNGLSHYCCVIDKEKETYSFLKDIPSYLDIIS
jgi:predicted type IV restriction endonuclease